MKVLSGNEQDVHAPINKYVGKSHSKGSTTGKSKKRVIIDRRRKRWDHCQVPSNKEEDRRRVGSDDSASGNEAFGGGESCGSDDEDDLSLFTDNLGEDDLELLNSLSGPSTSSSEDEGAGIKDKGKAINDEQPDDTASSGTFSSARKGGKRQIFLAANFSLAPGSPSPNRTSIPVAKPAHNETSYGGVHTTMAAETAGQEHTLPPSSSSPTVSSSLDLAVGSNSQLKDLIKETDCQMAVFTACSLLAGEKTLMALRLFTHWLYSYPIVFATCTKVCIHQISSGVYWGSFCLSY